MTQVSRVTRIKLADAIEALRDATAEVENSGDSKNARTLRGLVDSAVEVLRTYYDEAEAS